ncbi:hypothetical protein C3L33_00409, partial [Rhododendron williamsianum]
MMISEIDSDGNAHIDLNGWQNGILSRVWSKLVEGELILYTDSKVGCLYRVKPFACFLHTIGTYWHEKFTVWESNADGAFAASEDTWKEPLGRGTEIRLHLREEAWGIFQGEQMKVGKVNMFSFVSVLLIHCLVFKFLTNNAVEWNFIFSFIEVENLALKDQSKMSEPVKELDILLAQIAAGVPLDRMRGPNDLENFSLPRQVDLRLIDAICAKSLSKYVIVSEIGSGWLDKSAVGKLTNYKSLTSSIQDLFLGNGVGEWQGQIVPPSRYVWLRCFGVPLNLWSEKTFLSIGGLWGDVISVDDNTLKSLSFEEGRLFIATDIMDRVDEEVELKFRERSIKIRVAEEIPSNVGFVVEAPLDEAYSGRKKTASVVETRKTLGVARGTRPDQEAIDGELQ